MVAMFWEPCDLRYGDISNILCPFSIVFIVVMWVIFKTKQLSVGKHGKTTQQI